MKIKFEKSVYDKTVTRLIEKAFNEQFTEGLTIKEIAHMQCDANTGFMPVPVWEDGVKNINNVEPLGGAVALIGSHIEKTYICLDFIEVGWKRAYKYSELFNLEPVVTKEDRENINLSHCCYACFTEYEPAKGFEC